MTSAPPGLALVRPSRRDADGAAERRPAARVREDVALGPKSAAATAAAARGVRVRRERVIRFTSWYPAAVTLGSNGQLTAVRVSHAVRVFTHACTHGEATVA